MKRILLGLLSALALASIGFAADDAKPAAAAPDKKSEAATFADPSKLTEKAPESFKAKFTTTKGAFTIEVTRSLSPNGADRFYNLVKSGYFQDVAFFRVIPGFMGQFGIHGDPKVSAAWRGARIQDDPVKASNKRGYLSFAMAGPNTRTTQFFINLVDNTNLDSMGFSPFGKVVEGQDVVDKINGEYGEGAPRGRGPNQAIIQEKGNEYLKASYPNLDYIKSAALVP
jgi:peptidyl-prolyl cis-trans isomerase A (cyclophilin A)